MAEIHGGWRRHRRRGRSERAPTDYGGDNYEDYSLSSDPDVIAHERRDPALDDAFFGFFMKQAVNSLKRNFSDFCKDTIGTNEVKKSKIDGVDKSVFTRYGCKYFLQVLKKLNSAQRAIIEKFGFRCLLLFDCCHIPSDFCRWVADCIDPHCSQITICGKSIKISKDTFHIVLGLPIGWLQFPSNCEDGRAFIVSHFKLSEMPHITFFGNKLSRLIGSAFTCVVCLRCTDLTVPLRVLDVIREDSMKDPATDPNVPLARVLVDQRSRNCCCRSPAAWRRASRINLGRQGIGRRHGKQDQGSRDTLAFSPNRR